MNKSVLEIINDSSDIKKEIDNEELIINFYNNNLDTINIDITQKENSRLVINFVSIVNKKIDVNIKSNIVGNNNKCVINVRTIAEKESSTFNVVAHTLNGTKDNEIIEDLKGINEGGGVALIPVLEIDTNEVMASHFATVGGFDKSLIFYLESKGLSKDTVYNMLRTSFLHSIFNKEFIERITNE